MIDLGDVYSKTYTVKNPAGVPADAGTFAVTITLPDGTNVAGPITHTANTGVYLLGYPTTQSGQHIVEIVGTGVNAFTTSDVFQVAPAKPGFVISLEQARKSLRMPAGQTIDDEDLRDLIASATAPIEDMCGPILARACDDWLDGGWDSVRLLQAPCIAITAVTESFGAGYTRTLTSQPLDGTTFDGYGYTVDLVDGLVIRRAMGTAAPFMTGRRNIHVTYTAGRVVIPQNLIRATRRLVRFMWQQEMQGQRPNGSSPEMVSTPSGYLVPNAIRTLCGAELKSIAQG